MKVARSSRDHTKSLGLCMRIDIRRDRKAVPQGGTAPSGNTGGPDMSIRIASMATTASPIIPHHRKIE